MAAPSPSQALRVPGKLCFGPTNLSTAFPHGGTALGLVKSAAWAGGEIPSLETAEEWGGVVTGVTLAREPSIFSCTYRGWDKDAITKTMLDPVVGGTTSRVIHRGEVGTDGTRPGAQMGDQAGVLYFSPLADQHPGLLMFHAIPMPDAAAKWLFSAADEFEVGAIWFCAPADIPLRRIFDVGLRGDLSLT